MVTLCRPGGGGVTDPQKMPIFWCFRMFLGGSRAEHMVWKYDHIAKVGKINIKDSEEVVELAME